MISKTIYKYFKIIYYLQIAVGAIPEEIELGTKFRTYLLNKVWPLAFWMLWLPLFTITTLKVKQFLDKRAWHDLLDIMHVYLLGVTTHYFGFAVQQRARNFKKCMDIVKDHFVACGHLTWKDFRMWISLALMMFLSICVFLSASAYHGELPVPQWVPFLDNEKPLPYKVYAALWAYQIFTAVFMVWIYGFLTPFVIVITTILIQELDLLVRKGEQFVYFEKYQESSVKSDILDLNPINYSEKDTKRFVRRFVEHQIVILSVINEVKKIHNYFFLTQVLFTISHSCFLAFHIYYTNDPTKAVVKSSPFLVVSYYLLFIYCWNGQRLTDKCDELHWALYRGRWYSSPRSYKSSLLIVLHFCQRPVRLTGGGVFNASFSTFLKGVEQSISYVLVLKQLLSRGGRS